MRYIEQTTLARRGANEGEEADQVEGILLVGDGAIAHWREDSSSLGYDAVSIYPAVWKGERVWLLNRDWEASRGYSASGREEVILAFEEGVRMLIAHGCFEHLWRESPA